MEENYLEIPTITWNLYNNIPSMIPQCGVWEGRVYANLTSTSEVEGLFPIDPSSRENSPKQSRKINNSSTRNNR